MCGVSERGGLFIKTKQEKIYIWQDRYIPFSSHWLNTTQFVNFYYQYSLWPLGVPTFCRNSTRMGMSAALSCSSVKRDRGVRTNSLVCPYATSSWKPCCVTIASTASLSVSIRWLGQVYSHVILYLQYTEEGRRRVQDTGSCAKHDNEWQGVGMIEQTEWHWG